MGSRPTPLPNFSGSTPLPGAGCRDGENNRVRIVRVLMFPVAALIIESFSLLSYIKKIHCLTSEFHGKFYA